MPKSHLVAAITCAASIWITGMVHAAPISSAEFSADTYQKGPQGSESSGKIYLGENRIRMETSQNGQQVIQIIDVDKQMTLMIFPAQRSYIEQRGVNPVQAAASSGNSGEINPCQGLQGAQCQKLGRENISGRSAVKWEMSFTRQGKTLHGTQWIDADRGMVLKQQMSNGQGSEMKFIGMDNLGGRKEEKWEVTYYQKDRSPQRSYRWFDPELNLIVKEEFPGGFVREMRNIHVAPQDPALFEVPLGYKKIDPKQFPPGAGIRR